MDRCHPHSQRSYMTCSELTGGGLHLLIPIVTMVSCIVVELAGPLSAAWMSLESL